MPLFGKKQELFTQRYLPSLQYVCIWLMHTQQPSSYNTDTSSYFFDRSSSAPFAYGRTFFTSNLLPFWGFFNRTSSGNLSPLHCMDFQFELGDPLICKPLVATLYIFERLMVARKLFKMYSVTPNSSTSAYTDTLRGDLSFASNRQTWHRVVPLQCIFVHIPTACVCSRLILK